MAEVLIAGSTGGREHALGKAIADSGEHSVYFSHGNGGSRLVGENLGLRDNAAIVDYAVRKEVDLVVIGPEAPLVAGLGDQLRTQGVTVFGPNRDGAELERSKRFTAEFNSRHGIPQPDYQAVTELKDGLFIARKNPPEDYVIKADGLAAGKGVVLPKSKREAVDVITAMMTGKILGGAGEQIVLQKRMRGREISAFVVTDGKNFTLLPTVQDHKRLKDGDEGPNTGGMGAYTPVPFVNANLIEQIMDIGERTVNGLTEEGIDYRGALFLGLMLDEDDGNRPKVMEFNVRFGDPETQALMAALDPDEVNVHDLLDSAARGKLDRAVAGKAITGVGRAAVSVCLAAPGYPQKPQTGQTIYSLYRGYEGVYVHHAGTEYRSDEDGRTVTAGGRVAFVTGYDKTVQLARRNAYAAIGDDAIYFDGMQVRGDIAHQALN